MAFGPNPWPTAFRIVDRGNAPGTRWIRHTVWPTAIFNITRMRAIEYGRWPKNHPT